MKVSELTNEVHNGGIVLPDFQRSFIWEPEDIRELLVSVLGGYFVGSMLLLEQFKDDSYFALRLVEGVEKMNSNPRMQSVVKIILDGQQRTTSLYYALFEPDLPLKHRKSAYHFYLDLDEAIKANWDKAVIAVNVRDSFALSQVQNDHTIRFSLLRDFPALAQRFKDHPKFSEIVTIANDFTNREIYTVPLPRDTDPDRIVETFERINRTGEPLSTFELVTARLYKYKIKLRDLLDQARTSYGFTSSIPPEFILRVIALLRGKELKRKSILDLDPKEFQIDWDRACEALEHAFKRVTDLKDGYGVFDFKKWMPYTTMIVPLAALIDHVREGKKDNVADYDKIDSWYWTSVFSKRFDSSADSTATADFSSVKDWIDNEDLVPEFVEKFSLRSIDFDTDQKSSAIYRGVICFVVKHGALDFETGQPPQFDKKRVQDDHIFPKKTYRENRIANRTLISRNQRKSYETPSKYFGEKLSQQGKGSLTKILMSHLIPENALPYLLEDKIGEFMKARQTYILQTLGTTLNLASSEHDKIQETSGTNTPTLQATSVGNPSQPKSHLSRRRRGGKALAYNLAVVLLMRKGYSWNEACHNVAWDNEVTHNTVMAATTRAIRLDGKEDFEKLIEKGEIEAYLIRQFPKDEERIKSALRS